MKKIIIGSLSAISMILLTYFFLLPVGRTSPGIYTCKIKQETKSHQGGYITDKVYVIYSPEEENGGCTHAEIWCTFWCQVDTCDWERGVSVAKSVCNSPELMPHCTGEVPCPT